MKVFIRFNFTLLSLVFFCVSCQNIDRPFVITNSQQVADLYCYGELTDTKGNRWSVYIVPGAQNIVNDAKEGWKDAGKNLTAYSEADFWKELKDWSCSSVEFAEDSAEFSLDSITEYWLKGILEDHEEASQNISSNFREAPFGWIPRVVGNLAWGYVIKPVFRTATAPVGVVLGFSGIALGGTGSILLPVGGFFAPPVAALVNSTIHGFLVPVTLMVAHQFVYVLVLPNREPAENMDGRFGLTIVNKNNDSSEIVLISPGKEEEFPITNIESRPLLEKEYIQKLMGEYILLQKATIIAKETAKNLEHLNLYIVIQKNKIIPFAIDEVILQYINEQLFLEFSKNWQSMIETLPSDTSATITEEEAYTDFRHILELYD